MDIVPKLFFIILIAVLLTVIFASVTYAIFKLREHRSPERLRREMEKRRFFKKFSINS